MSRPEDLASIIAREQHQIPVAGLVLMRLWWLHAPRSTLLLSFIRSGGAVMLHMSRPLPGSVAT